MIKHYFMFVKLQNLLECLRHCTLSEHKERHVKMGVTEVNEKSKYALCVCVFAVAPHVLGPRAARWRGAAGEDPQKATFQRNGGQPHHAKAGVGRQSHARCGRGAQGP